MNSVGDINSYSRRASQSQQTCSNQLPESFWGSTGGSGSIDQATYIPLPRTSHNYPPLHSIPNDITQHRQNQVGRPSQYSTYPLPHTLATEYRFSSSHVNSTPRQSQGSTAWVEGVTWSQAQEASGMISPDSRSWSDMSSFWPDIDAVQPSTPATPGQNRPPFDAPYRFSSPSSCSSPYSSAPHSPKLQQTSRPMSPLSAAASSQSPSRQNCPSPGTNTEGIKMCTHCKATSTPLWRRDPQTLKQLCNACGLYLQQRHKLRPQELIDADAEDDEEEDMSPDWNGNECTHCHTRNTSVWRRSKDGEQLCNACGVYKRLRGKDRPLELKRNRIKPRSKHTTK